MCWISESTYSSCWMGKWSNLSKGCAFFRKDEGAIEFSLNGKDYYDVNSPSLKIQPKGGRYSFFSFIIAPQDYSLHNRYR